MSLRRSQGWKIKTAVWKSCVQKWAGLKDQEMLSLPEGVCCCEMPHTFLWPLEMTASQTRMSKWWHTEEGKEFRGIFCLIFGMRELCWGTTCRFCLLYAHLECVDTRTIESSTWTVAVLHIPCTHGAQHRQSRPVRILDKPRIPLDLRWNMAFGSLRTRCWKLRKRWNTKVPPPPPASVQLTVCHAFGGCPQQVCTAGPSPTGFNAASHCQSSLPACKRNTGNHFQLHIKRSNCYKPQK